MRLLNLFGVSFLAQLLVFVHGAVFYDTTPRLSLLRQRRPVTFHVSKMSGDVIAEALTTHRGGEVIDAARTTVAELRQRVLELAPLPLDQTYDLIFIPAPAGERPTTPCPIMLENDGSTLAKYGIVGGGGKITKITAIGRGAERRQELERFVGFVGYGPGEGRSG